MSLLRFVRGKRPAGHAARPFAVAAVGPVRPGRVRNPTKTGPEEKIKKKPADGGRKKTPPARKAPARGRYVDEYAYPPTRGPSSASN